jgi:hypothetical protein
MNLWFHQNMSDGSGDGLCVKHGTPETKKPLKTGA